MENNKNKPLFVNPLEASKGLTINDLNKYLPALQKIVDLKMTKNEMRDGLFHGIGLEGLKKIPSNSIDLIVTDPPENPRKDAIESTAPLTIQDYFEWNELWLSESHRVLKETGAIYIICGWRYSGMYHSLLSNQFQIQTRISWMNTNSNDQPNLPIWKNSLSDIWFATKSGEFMFDQKPVSKLDGAKNLQSNFWSDMLGFGFDNSENQSNNIPDEVIKRVLKASSFKLNWVLDPFARTGDTGI